MSTTTVTSTAGLTQALQTAQSGDTILLAAGSYSGVYIPGFHAAGNVTIASADPLHRAVLSDLLVQGSSGLTFSQLEFSSDIPSFSGLPSSTVTDPYPFRISASDRVTLNGMSLHGSLDNDPSNDRAGLLISNSDHVTVSSSEFEQLSMGVVLSDSTNLNFSNNNIHDIRSGGIAGSSSFVTLVGNYFHDFHPVAGDHPDAIHFYNENSTDAPHDIVARANVVMAGSGSPIQGIFLELPFATSVPTYNVSITDNLLVGTLYNAIAVLAQDGTVNHGIVISNNSINSIGDITARIWVGNSDGTLITNNFAGAYIFGTAFNASFDPKNTNTNITMTNDVISSPVTDGGQALFTQWLAAHPSFTANQQDATSSPVVLEPPPVPVPAPVVAAALALDAAADSGIKGDGITNVAKVKLDGSARAGSAVTVYEGSTVVGTAIADANGAFKINANSALHEGKHTFSALATDGAGQASSVVAALDVIVDTQAAVGGISNFTASVSGKTVAVSLSGIAIDSPPGPISVAVYQDGALAKTVAASGGGWSTSLSNVSNAVHNYTLKLTDAAGNMGDGANTLILGSSGGDVIRGGAGTDVIYGGAGIDTLSGGGGNDVFVWLAAGDAPVPNAGKGKAVDYETITDFQAGDRLDFSDLGHLSFGGQSQSVKAYQVAWYASSGNTYVITETTGDAKADMIVELLGGHSLSAADFLLA